VSVSPGLISLVIADDHPVVLEGLAGVLNAEKDFEILAKCRTGLGAFRAITELRPDVALLDISMEEMDGLAVMAQVRSEGSKTKVILLTAHTTDRQLLSGIENGARALLLKDAPVSELPEAIRRVVAGDRLFPADLVDAALGRESGRKAAEDRFKILSPRERAVMCLVAEGLSNKEIGQKLTLSEGTVKIHLHNIYQKTGLTNRTSLAAFMLAHQER
jgi:DNA-binding NarL/FixJ family response regulator